MWCKAVRIYGRHVEAASEVAVKKKEMLSAWNDAHTLSGDGVFLNVRLLTFEHWYVSCRINNSVSSHIHTEGLFFFFPTTLNELLLAS